MLHLHGSLDIDVNDARDARFLHGDAYQLLRHFHRYFIMADEQKLCMFRHFFHHIAESLGIAVVERRINLIHEAEWCGIEPE